MQSSENLLQYRPERTSKAFIKIAPNLYTQTQGMMLVICQGMMLVICPSLL